jgi:lambda family phage portal protein
MNGIIEEHWQRWSHPENASITGKLSFADCLRKFVNDLARDGEVLCRFITADNPYGFSLKFIDVTWLDEMFNEVRPGGNRVVMSVELNADDRPVAYWLTPPPDQFSLPSMAQDRKRVRVPAEEIVHCFLPFDENSGDGSQTRGVPFAHAAMLNLWQLGAFEESAVIASRIGASKMGFFRKKPDEFGLAGDTSLLQIQTSESEDTGPTGPKFFDHVEPGQFGIIDDYEFQSFDPQYPSEMVDPFITKMLKGVASALDVSYFSLGNDLSDVNFSSARVHLLEERDCWRALQQFVIEHFCRRVYLTWLKAGMMTGTIEIRRTDFDRLTEPKWIARGWAWVDPLKEVQAKVLEIDNLLESRTHAIAEGGGNIEDLFKEVQEETQLAEEYGIELPPPGGFQPEPVDDEEKPAKPQN